MGRLTGELVGAVAAGGQQQHGLRQQLPTPTRALPAAVHCLQGGTYGQAVGLKIANRSGWLEDERYAQPGFKVMHVPDFDFRSSCVLLAECLAELRAWSGERRAELLCDAGLEAGRALALGVTKAAVRYGVLAVGPRPPTGDQPPPPAASPPCRCQPVPPAHPRVLGGQAGGAAAGRAGGRAVRRAGGPAAQRHGRRPHQVRATGRGCWAAGLCAALPPWPHHG